MKIVIQCAGKKQKGAGSLLSPQHDSDAIFVAHPELLSADIDHSFFHPDELSIGDKTWREKLVEYNRQNIQTNPQGLLQAYQLYTNPIYEKLVQRFGIDKIFILSAGWGLVSANFLLPNYNISFTAKEKLFKRNKKDAYKDFNHLTNDNEDVVFLGEESYLPLFVRLTKDYEGRKIVYYNSKHQPHLPSGYETILFKTTQLTNWHYTCAEVLVKNQ